MSRPITTDRRLWRVAGALALAHVALLLGGVSLETTPMLGGGRAAVSAAYVHGSMTPTFTGGYLEFLGFLVFLVVSVLLGQLLRGTGTTPAWLSSCITASGVTYTAVTIATGFAAGAAALYNGHHGASLDTITTVNDVRNFAFFLSIGVLGVFTLAVAGAISATRTLPRWLAWSGYLVGALSIGAVPFARIGGLDVANLIWLVWFVVLGIAALRGPRTPAPSVPDGDLIRA
jgi:hypothetical protein